MDYNVQSNIKKTVFSDVEEITNTNVDWNRFNGKTVLITGAGGFIEREPRKSLASFLKEMTLSLLLPMLQTKLNAKEQILSFMQQVRQVIFSLKPTL